MAQESRLSLVIDSRQAKPSVEEVAKVMRLLGDAQGAWDLYICTQPTASPYLECFLRQSVKGRAMKAIKSYLIGVAILVALYFGLQAYGEFKYQQRVSDHKKEVLLAQISIEQGMAEQRNR